MATVADLLQVGSVDAEEHEARLAGGVTVRFRGLVDATDMLRIARDAGKFANRCQTNPLPDWKPYLPADEQVCRMAWEMHARMIDPPMTAQDALQLAKQRGAAFTMLYAEMQKGIGDWANAEAEELDRLGESSEPTATGAHT
jgi:hypothetical protein